jgi:hypothetical protein
VEPTKKRWRRGRDRGGNDAARETTKPASEVAGSIPVFAFEAQKKALSIRSTGTVYSRVMKKGERKNATCQRDDVGGWK